MVSLSISRGQLGVGLELQLLFGEVMIRLGLLEGRLPAKPARALWGLAIGDAPRHAHRDAFPRGDKRAQGAMA
jgi:hypothetical protein